MGTKEGNTIPRDNRIKNYVFPIGSLTANEDGLFSVYSDHTINGTIHSISVGSNTYTNTGSIAIYASGTDNATQQDLIMRFRAGSKITSFYPFTYMHDNQSIIGSQTNVSQYTQYIMNAPLRVVGSGLGASTSGLYLNVRYI